MHWMHMRKVITSSICGYQQMPWLLGLISLYSAKRKYTAVILCNTVMIMANSTLLSGPGPAILLSVSFFLVML